MAKLTNRTGLSDSIAEAVKQFHNEYDKVGWKSVTTLIDSPRCKLLTERHDDQIQEDVSDLLWSFFGNMGHLIAERNTDPNSIAERRFIYKHGDKQISFKPDLLERDPDDYNSFQLNDFKFTSVYILKSAVQGNPKKEWVRQMNFYVWCLGKLGFNITKIKLHVIARDWRASEKLREKFYPEQACAVVEVPIWNKEKAEAYCLERIRIHEEAEQLDDNDLPKCSEEERWADPDRWAVVKSSSKASSTTGYKKALPKATSFQTRSDAKHFIIQRNDKEDLEIEFRKGESRRCSNGYCKATAWCNQFKEEIAPAF
jgi:hypothetical protein|tara:strand:- start:4053 stop:4991 length:939 start_codon:yes stop_codon:yes gene_type:complete